MIVATVTLAVAVLVLATLPIGPRTTPARGSATGCLAILLSAAIAVALLVAIIIVALVR